jgi:hypothetical protein
MPTRAYEQEIKRFCQTYRRELATMYPVTGVHAKGTCCRRKFDATGDRAVK